jgi:hypothetical protein
VDGELQILMRARELADLEELAATVVGILGGARNAGLDPDALSGLIGAAIALGADGAAVYAAGKGAARYADERQFLADVSDVEDEIAERLMAAGKLWDQATDAAEDAADDLRGSRRQLAAAYSMPTHQPCDGCHAARAAAIEAAREEIADANERIAVCQSALEVLRELITKLRYALARIRAVPSDLGETYESVYNLIRSGGLMPYQGRWIEGASA